MRTRKLNKYIAFLILISTICINTAFAYDESTAVPASFYNIETITYSPVTTNTDYSFSEGTSRTKYAIKLVEYSNDTTSTESYKAIPHINIENRTATLSSSTLSEVCTLVAKVEIDYDSNSIDHSTTYYELTETQTYIYPRVNLNYTADDFTITLYYVFDYPSTLGTNNSEYLSLDTGGATNLYLFYLTNNVETVFYYGNLTDSIITPAIADFSSNGTIGTYLNINFSRPSTWTETGFFENLGSNYHEWTVSMQVGPSTATNTNYQVGLEITSDNNFTLISTDPGSGIKEVPYSIKLSETSSSNTVEIDSTDKILIQRIRRNREKVFYIYTYSSYSDTSALNSGRFTDNIYLNFTTIETGETYNADETIRVFSE
ncbi:MAG: hypothetical protein OWP43_03475 [Sphaerochaetaceae bacterium]|nr:hypothetical protein [Sphaerochaetaceae bacterium]